MCSKCVYTVWPFVCLALGCIGGPAARGQGFNSPAAPVALYTDFKQPAAPPLIEAVRAEVESVMAPAGLRFEWRPLAEFSSQTVSAALVVVHFDTRCDAAGLVMRSNQSGSLGWTEISGGTILPFIHVDCGRVRPFLQTPLLGYRPESREAIYARALGRVLAHELCHVLIATPKHAVRGVSKEEYSSHDLLASQFTLHEKEIEALRASRAMTGLRAAK